MRSFSRREILRVLPAASLARQASARRPTNLILILADNLGPHPLGCYGNRDVRTPNIDRLAREGMLFRQAFAVNAVCSPTRASLLTGLMPSQHGVHSYLGAGGAQIGPQAYNTIAEFETLPKILTRNGYAAGLCGKWHLGANLEPQEGFTYWVTQPHGNSRGFYDQEVIENGQIRKEPTYLTDFWTRHALRFLEQNKDRPFFLFLPYNGPYGLGGALQEPIRNAHAAYYAGHELPSFPRDAPHPWLYHYRDILYDADVRRKYAAEISGIDDNTGRILDWLARNRLDGDTLVVFTADQGLATGQSGLWGMGDHTRPLTAFDGTMRVPLIFRQPGRIAAGAQCERMVSTCDLLPSILSHLGLAGKLPSRPALSGRDMEALLAGRQTQWEDIIFFEFENVRCVRTPQWKYVERIHQEPNELYDLLRDPGERLNLYGRSEYAAQVEQLRGRMRDFFRRYAEARWDLWNGGRSKADLLTADLFGIENPYRKPAPRKAPPSQP